MTDKARSYVQPCLTGAVIPGVGLQGDETRVGGGLVNCVCFFFYREAKPCALQKH